MKPSRWLLLAVALLAASMVAGKLSASAGPYVPAADAEVIASVPKRSSPEQAALSQARMMLSAAPNDPAAAAAYARTSISIGRRLSDPRYLGKAQAALMPWWKDEAPPEPVRLQRAVIRQSLHDFDGALTDLDALAAAADGGAADDATILLTRATVLTVVGRYAEALRACDALNAIQQEPALKVVCTAVVDSQTGKAQEAYAAISAIDPSQWTTAERGWLLSTRAELAVRAGKDDEAEKAFRAAIAEDDEDTYSRAALADLLMDQGKPAEAAKVVRERADAELLRLAIATQRAGLPKAADYREELRARFDAARERGDSVHRREESRFQLELEGDLPKALELAEANWKVQREPADARVLLEAALKAGKPEAATPVVEALKRSGAEEPRLIELVKKVSK